MPLLTFHCRTRLFLAIVQQRAIPGGSRTSTQAFTVAGTVNEFHIFPHHDLSINFLFTINYKLFKLFIFDILIILRQKK